MPINHNFTATGGDSPGLVGETQWNDTHTLPSAAEVGAEVAGAVSTHESLYNHTNFEQKSSTLVTVAVSGADYTSVAAAISGITDASATKPYTVLVKPGIYTESPFTLKSYVTIQGEGGFYGVTLSTNDENNHFLTGAAAAELTNIVINGPTGTGFAAVFHNTVGTSPLKLVSCIIRKGYYGVWCDGGTSSSSKPRVHVIHSANWYNGSPIERFFYASQYGNITTMDTAIMSGPGGAVNYGWYVNGAGTEVTIDNCSFRNGKNTPTDTIFPTAIYCNDGIIRCKSVTVAEAHTGITVDSAGTVHVVGGEISGVVSGNHINILNGNATVRFSGNLNVSQISNGPGGDITVNATDLATGEFYLVDATGEIPLKDYSKASASTGWVSGGVVTDAGGLDIDITASTGYINTGTSVNKVSYAGVAGETLTDDKAALWVYYDGTGALIVADTEPGYDDVILLAIVTTKSGNIEMIADHRIPVRQVVPSIAEWMEEVVGPINGTGMVASISASTTEIDVTDGEYFLIQQPITTTGGVPITFTPISGGNVYASPTSFPDLTQYDDAGTLTAIPAGEYAKHLLFATVSPNGTTQYFLIYGQETFASQGLAEAGNNPVAPSALMAYACRVAGVVVGEGIATIVSIVDQRPKLGQMASGSTSVTDHGNLTGLADDDHQIYYNETRLDNYITAHGIGGAVSISAGSVSVTAGSLEFVNSNGISFGLNTTNQITAAHNALTATSNYISVAATSGYGTNVPLQTVTGASSQYLAGNGGWSSFPAQTVPTITMNGSTTTGNFNIAGGGYMTTATAQSGVTVGAATSALSTVFQLTGNYQTTGNYASSNHTHSQYAVASLFSGTNISATINSTAFNMIGAVGTGTAATNASVTLGTGGISLNVATFNSTSFASQSATPTQVTAASSVLYNNGSWGTVAAGGGIQSINGNSATAQSITVATSAGLTTVASATNGVTFGLHSNWLNASVIKTTGASSSYLGADGGYYTAGGGGVTNNYTGWALQYGPVAIDTNNTGTVRIMGSGPIGVQWSNATATTNAHTFYITKEADIYNSGFVLQGNTAGSSSYGNTTEKMMSFYGGSNITLSGTNDNVISIIGPAAGGGATLTQLDWPPNWFGYIGSTAMVTNSITIQQVDVLQNVQFSRVDVPLYISMGTSNTASTGGWNVTAYGVLYTRNSTATGGSSVLSPIACGSSTWSITGGSALGTGGSFGGPRFARVAMTTTLTPGIYWYGFGMATATASTSQNVIIRPMLASMNSSNTMHFFPYGSSAAHSLNLNRTMGVLSTSAYPSTHFGASSTNLVNINFTNASWLRTGVTNYSGNIPVLFRS